MRLWWWIIFLAASPAFSQISVPKFSNEFLSLGVGARGLGMGNSQIALASDVTSGYWNPAGLSRLASTHEFSIMHAEYFAGIAKYDYAAFATRIDSLSALAVSLIRFGIDDIPDTRFLYDANGNINYDNIKFFSAADYAILFSYARQLNILNGVRIGGNFKIIHRIAGSFANAWGFGIDAGAQMDLNAWKIGLSFRDISGTFTAWTHSTDLVIDVYTQTGNIIPQNTIEVTLPKTILGLARELKFGDKFKVIAALDMALTFDGKRNVLIKSDIASIDPSFGMEVDFKNLVFLRGGIKDYQKVKNFDGSKHGTYQPNFGLGFRVKKATIDYALTDIGDRSESLYSHVFSLKVSLEKKK